MSRRVHLLSLLLCLAIATVAGGCQQAYFKALNAGLPDDLTRQSVEYDSSHSLWLDVYRPRRQGSADAVPVLVFFYGGSWHNGTRGYYRFVGEALAARGVMVVIPDYRKAPHNRFPDFMEDAASATAWAQANATRLGGDPARLFLMGHSAGAHIVALLGTDASYLEAKGMEPRAVAGIIGLAGPYDFVPGKRALFKQVFGDAAVWPRTQPANFVDGDEPPFLLLHGASDYKVAAASSETFAAKLRATGEAVDLRIIPKTGHLGLVNGFRSVRFSPVLDETMQWIGRARPVAFTLPKPAASLKTAPR